MLKEGVAVSFGIDGCQPVKVVDVNVDKNAKHACEHLLADSLEVLGELGVRVRREDCLVADLRLHPREKAIVVESGGQCCRFL